MAFVTHNGFAIDSCNSVKPFTRWCKVWLVFSSRIFSDTWVYHLLDSYSACKESATELIEFNKASQQRFLWSLDLKPAVRFFGRCWLRYVSVDMNKICVILSFLALAACEARLDNKVGYGKTLDFPAEKMCFNVVFEELKARTAYTLSITTVEENGKIMKYELTIDGQAFNEDIGVFTPTSFQLSKEFMSNVQQRCTG